MKSLSKQLQEIVRKYQKAGMPWPASSQDIAAWAVEQKLWAPRPSLIVKQCADQLSKAMREEYVTDAQGRRVRAKHAASVRRNGQQMVLWADIRSASREHLKIAFQQRRQQIVGDCTQLKNDIDSFNDNRPDEESIQMIFDFTDDIEEANLAA